MSEVFVESGELVNASNSANDANLVSSSTSLSWRQLIQKLSSIDKCIEFAREYKLLPDRELKNCVHCRSQSCVTSVVKNSESNCPLQLSCRKCGKRTAIRKNTWFESSKFSIEKSLVLVSCWIRCYTLEVAASETDLTSTTVLDYYGLCRDVCYIIVTNSSAPVGGQGKVVEIEETYIATGKHRSGQVRKDIEHNWIFGGIERDTKKCFIVKVYSREKATLVPLIKHFVLPGTKIITDGWESYKALKSDGFDNDFVNHPVEFISSDDASVHSQKERLWKTLKSNIKREGRRGELEEMYLFQYMYFHNLHLAGITLPCKKLPIFLRDIARVYPGYGLKGLKAAVYTSDGIVEDANRTETDIHQENNTDV